jgi:hypothetical protein
MSSLSPHPGCGIRRRGGRIEAAKKFGVDMTLLIEQLRLEPGERVRRLHDLAQTAERVRGAARRK